MNAQPAQGLVEVAGLILAGGASRRFGTDKALHQIDGEAMIARVFRAMRDVAAPILISVADAARRYPVDAVHVVDRYPDGGPLAGIHAGLASLDVPWLLVCACDLPFVTSDVLRRMRSFASDDVEAVVALQSDGQTQPLCAIYHRRLLPRVEAALARGNRGVRRFVESLSSVRLIDATDEPLRNINRPEDL